MILTIRPKIFIAGVDCTRDLFPFLLSISYTDNLSGEADTLDVELMDKDRLFIGDWMPTLSDTLQVSLTKDSGTGQLETLDLGTFEIDEIQAEYPPSIFRIQAVSVSQNSALRQRDESRAWENVKLSKIAQDIANAAGVTLFYKADDDPTITRAEQQEQSRLAFLEKLCKDNFLALKVSDGQLIIFDESELDKQEPALTLYRHQDVINFQARWTIQEIYGRADVAYHHGQKDELIQGSFECGASSRVLKINQKCETQAEAERLARNKLREKNREGVKISLTTIGTFALLAGNVVALKNFGKFDYNYVT
ncbi:MAG: hypothetical protein IJP68_13160 [Selenomonadaceae bacterium]|nr:hypothetical protein [Selenomonadaceae bacterium]